MLRRTISLTAILCVVGLAWVGEARAQGCPAFDPTLVTVNPERILAELPEHTATLADGTQAVTKYVLGWMLRGAVQPVQQADIPKTAFTLIAGTSYCYGATLQTPLPSIPIGGPEYVAVLCAVRETDGLMSDWSVPSNPFVYAGPPGVPFGLRWLRRTPAP